MTRRAITTGLTGLAALAALGGVGAGVGIAKTAREGAPPMTTLPATTPATTTPATPTPTSTPTSTTLTGAATKSAASEGFKYRLSLRERIPNEGTVTIGGGGDFSTANRDGAARFTIHVDGHAMPIQEIFLGTTFYVKEPPSLTAQLPGQKPWLKVDLSKARGKNLKRLASVLSASSQEDPTQILSYLTDESQSIKTVGPATVDGVPTTHYSALIDLAKAGAGQPPALKQKLQKVLQGLSGQIVDEHDIPVDVWIDGSQLVRREKIALAVEPAGTTEEVITSTTIDIPNYGPQPTPTPPPASETTNLLGLLNSEHAHSDR